MLCYQYLFIMFNQAILFLTLHLLPIIQTCYPYSLLLSSLLLQMSLLVDETVCVVLRALLSKMT